MFGKLDSIKSAIKKAAEVSGISEETINQGREKLNKIGSEIGNAIQERADSSEAYTLEYHYTGKRLDDNVYKETKYDNNGIDSSYKLNNKVGVSCLDSYAQKLTLDEKLEEHPIELHFMGQDEIDMVPEIVGHEIPIFAEGSPSQYEYRDENGEVLFILNRTSSSANGETQAQYEITMTDKGKLHLKKKIEELLTKKLEINPNKEKIEVFFDKWKKDSLVYKYKFR